MTLSFTRTLTGINELISAKLPAENGFKLRFYRLALINILSNLMVPLSSFLGISFLGHLETLSPLAGVTLATVLFNYLYRLLGFLRMSTTGTTAQAVGRSDKTEVQLILLRNLSLALLLGVLIILLSYPVQQLGFSWLNATDTVKSSGIDYYNSRIWGIPAGLLNFVIIGWFLGQEAGGKVLLLSVIGNGANILLDYWFIVRLQLASSGAGMAAAISQYLMCLVGIAMIAQVIRRVELRHLLTQVIEKMALIEVFRFNLDIFIRTLAFLTVFSIFTGLSAGMGTEVLAENALLLEVITLVVYLVDGLAYATETFAGNFAGQSQRTKLLLLLRIAGATSLLIGLSCASVFTMFPQPLLGLLTNHQEIMQPLHQVVFWLLPILGFGSLAFMLDGYFLGLAEGKILRNTALLASIIGFLPIAITAWQWHSQQWLWLSLTCFMLLRVVLLVRYIPHSFVAPQTKNSESIAQEVRFETN